MCKFCGCTESEAIADARTIGVEQEFQSGIYTCCQIADWAQEQWLAWVEATEQDAEHAGEVMKEPELDEAQGILVPVRFRRPVPWFKNPDGLR
jgi:hypothetical protein